MFKQLFPVLLFPLILVGAGCAQTTEVEEEVTEEVVEEALLTDGSYALNLEDSSIRWDGAKAVGGAHFGSISASEGALMVQDGVLIGGTIVVDMTTVSSEDLEGSSKESLDGHLMSDDFFGVATHPTATFAIGEAVTLEGIEGSTHRVSGEMTIKGIGNEMSFPATFEMNGETLHMSAELEIDRSIHNVRYGSGSFFEDLGDNLINDEFQLTVDLSFNMGGEEVVDAEPSADMDSGDEMEDEDEDEDEDEMEDGGEEEEEGEDMDASVK
jgi:polyisoprenoid-binding protein YceI